MSETIRDDVMKLALGAAKAIPWLMPDEARNSAHIIAKGILADRAGREAEIAALRERAAFAEGVLARIEAELSRVKAELSEAVGLLRPFGCVDLSDGGRDDQKLIGLNNSSFTAGNFRAARAFITRMEASHG